MRCPAKLEKGATIGLVATSSQISEERQKECIETLEKMGYKVKCADNLTSNLAGFMAGEGEVRGKWLNQMFADPEVDAIFCVRGGDGGTRAVEYLDLDVIKANPKIFVGYSDVTTFHLLFTQSCDFITFHGPMVSSNMVDGFDAETEKSFFDCINADGVYEFKNPADEEILVLKEGVAEGNIIGGNLSLLSASVGTPYDMDAKDKILFIEEVCEPISKIEKWTYHLKNAGKFKKCKGVILGQFTKVDNEDMPEYDVIKLYEDLLKEYDIPLMYNIQAGHGAKNMTIPMGAKCTMNTEDKSIVFKVR